MPDFNPIHWLGRRRSAPENHLAPTDPDPTSTSTTYPTPTTPTSPSIHSRTSPSIHSRTSSRGHNSLSRPSLISRLSHQATTRKISLPPESAEPITVLSIPHVLWNNMQCRTYLTFLLSTHLSYDVEKAEEAAGKFEGDGDTMAVWGCKEWEGLLGGYYGKGVYHALPPMAGVKRLSG